MQRHNPNCKTIGFQRCLLGIAILLSNALVSLAQTPTNNPPDPLVKLVVVAETLIPKLQELIESPLIQGLENLAFWIAVIVMLLSFARLFRENDGASKDLFWWCFRLAIIFTLFGTGRTIINTASDIGYEIINVTEFRKNLLGRGTRFPYEL